MSDTNYWQKRLSRRRVLAGTGAGAGLLALTVVGCGGGDGDGEEQDNSGRISRPVNTSDQAKRGGIYQSYAIRDESNWDALTASRTPDAFEMVYSRPIVQKEAIGRPSKEEYQGDLASSWELAADGTTLTMKVNPQAKWDARAPTNSRAVDADDFVFSWNKFDAVGPNATDLSHKRSPAAPIESVTKIDNSTVQFKLAYPWSPLIAVLATGNWFIEPREADGGFNPRTDIRSTGPWVLQEYVPSAYMRWRKNPNWHRKDVPYMDGWDAPILLEAAARLAQFRTKNIWHINNVNARDLVDVLNSEPTVQAYAEARGQQVWHIDFGNRPGSPFNDRRLRQGISMSLDRELFANVHSDNEILESAGIGQNLTICTILSDNFNEAWIDPMGSGLGANAKYYKHDLAEAKKLISAAGHANTTEFTLHTRAVAKDEELLSGMMAEAGVKTKYEVWPSNNNDYITKVAYPYEGLLGNYEGMALRGSVGFNPSLMSFLVKMWHTDGRNPGARFYDGDEQGKMNALIEEGLRTTDANRHLAIAQELQKLHAGHQSAVPYWYNTNPLTLAWPWGMNRNVFQFREGNTLTTQMPYIWIDETKKS